MKFVIIKDRRFNFKKGLGFQQVFLSKLLTSFREIPLERERMVIIFKSSLYGWLLTWNNLGPGITGQYV